MKITVTFDSLEEFIQAMRPMEGFQDDPRNCAPTACQPGRTVDVWKDEPTAFEKAQEHVQKLAQEATAAAEPVPFEETKENPPKEEKTTLTEDFRVEVRRILAQLNKKTGQNTAAELIKAAGYGRLSVVPLDKLPGIMNAAKEALYA